MPKSYRPLFRASITRIALGATLIAASVAHTIAAQVGVYTVRSILVNASIGARVVFSTRLT